MKAIPIDIDEAKNERFQGDDECAAILGAYPDFYKRVGFKPPWIGYFFEINDEVVGAAGFKGPPAGGQIEIAYGTFKEHEGKGIATAMCGYLVRLTLDADPGVRITARTLPEKNASCRVLGKNGFVCKGSVWDNDDGTVWEWEYKGNAPGQ